MELIELIKILHKYGYDTLAILGGFVGIIIFIVKKIIGRTQTSVNAQTKVINAVKHNTKQLNEHTEKIDALDNKTQDLQLKIAKIEGKLEK